MLLLDNVDSFTYMLADYLRSAGAEVRVERSDRLSVEEALEVGADAIVISPGPGAPQDAGISVPLAAEAMERRIPLLGVCLGHQAMALAVGQEVERTPPVHGKTTRLRNDGSGLFAGLPESFDVARYHSLAVPRLSSPLVANAWAADGKIMAIRHESAPAHGLQFHPESIASEFGHDLIAAFVALAQKA